MKKLLKRNLERPLELTAALVHEYYATGDRGNLPLVIHSSGEDGNKLYLTEFAKKFLKVVKDHLRKEEDVDLSEFSERTDKIISRMQQIIRNEREVFKVTKERSPDDEKASGVNDVIRLKQGYDIRQVYQHIDPKLRELIRGFAAEAYLRTKHPEMFQKKNVESTNMLTHFLRHVEDLCVEEGLPRLHNNAEDIKNQRDYLGLNYGRLLRKLGNLLGDDYVITENLSDSMRELNLWPISMNKGSLYVDRSFDPRNTPLKIDQRVESMFEELSRKVRRDAYKKS